MFTEASLLTEISDVLKSIGVFSTVVIREDSSAVIGREPAAYIEYGGMTVKTDGGAYTQEHRVNVSVRLLSIGSADFMPLGQAVNALIDAGSASVSSALASTDSRTVTFKIEALYRN